MGSFTRGAVRWKFYDPALLWLFPLSYGVHLLEEWYATPPIALWGMHPTRPLTAAPFILANGAGLALMMIGIWLVGRSSRFHWIVPALAVAVLLNTAGHAAGSVLAQRYSAGLLTAVILWVPLGLLTLIRVWDQASARTLGAGLIVGAMIEIAVLAILWAM